MNPLIVEAIFKLLAAAPSIAADIEGAVNMHWGKDHVVQAQLGLGVLNKIFADALGTATSAP